MSAVANPGGLTVGETVRAFSHAHDWLSACGLDPDAGALLSLDEACTRASVDPREVLAGLATLASEDVADAYVELDHLCRFIVRHHHTYVRRTLPVIELALPIAQASLAPAGAVPLVALFADVPRDLLSHLAKEENILFPAIESLAEVRREGGRAVPGAFATLLHPIRAMESEHGRVEGSIRAMRELTADFADPPGAPPPVRSCYRALRAFDANLQQHIRLESELLFPRALELERAVS